MLILNADSSDSTERNMVMIIVTETIVSSVLFYTLL